MGQGQWCEVQQGQVPGPVLGSEQHHGMLQAGDRGSGKLQAEKDLKVNVNLGVPR